MVFTNFTAMKKNIFHTACFFIIMLTLMGAVACNKSNDKTSPTDSQICFYNASYTLQRQVNLDNYMERAVILFDESNPDFKRNRSDTGYGMPGFGNFNSIQFPNERYNSRQPQPWIIYMHTDAREHTINLLDTGRRLLIATKATTTIQTPVTIYFADSAGIFKALVTQDDQKIADTIARIRLVHLSPDAGQVYATINNNKGGALGNGLNYLQATPYQDLAVGQNDTLRVKIYRSGDTTAALMTRTTVEASPGHCYTLMLTGYYKTTGTYKAPDSIANIQIKPGLFLTTTKNY